MASEALCKRALDQHEDELVRRKNVVGLGIVQVNDKSERFRRRDLAVAVYVKKKLPVQELAPADVIPKELEVSSGKRIARVRTRVIEQGEVRLESAGLETL